MKKDWTYKKLGEVAEIVGGSTPKTSEPANWEGSNMWVTPAELDGSKYFGKTQRTISDKAASKLQLLPIGTVLFSSRAPIGKVAITTAPMYCNQGFKNVICGDNLYNEYVYWCLTYNIPLLQSFGVGATFKELSKSAMSDFSIPIPPLSIQRSIVSELDLLHLLIEKKQEQLRALDNLAQSLFYQMFGDPITNPMGWEIKKFAELYKLKSGDGLSAKMFENGPYPVYGGNGISGQHCSYNMDGNYIIIGRVGVYCGNVRNVVGKFWLTDNAFQLFYDEDNNNPIFVTKLLTYLNLNQYANQAAQPVISNITLKDILVPLPPLSLQQSFAAKVSAIEAQKQAITQSIHHTEALLAQRMDQYFG